MRTRLVIGHLAFAALAVWGCSGTIAMPAPPTPAEAPTGSSLPIVRAPTDNRFIFADTVAASLAAAYAALPRAYQVLGIAAAGIDPETRTIVSTIMNVRRQLAGRQLSRTIDCGSTAYGLSADVNDVTLRISTTVDQGPEGRAILRSALSAGSTAPGNHSYQNRCVSTGGLERMIATKVAELAAK